MKIDTWVRETLTVGRTRIAWQDFKLVLLGAAVLLGLTALEQRLSAFFAVRVLLGLIYVFFVPGYCLTTALFPLASDLYRPARLGLSLALSVATVSILALILDRLQLGLHRWSILIGEYAATGTSMAIALWRRSRLAAEETSLGQLDWHPARWWQSLPRSRRSRYTKAAFGLGVICAFTAWAYISAAPSEATTEFYVLGSGNLIQAYPYQVPLDERVKVTVGVRNREDSPMQYHIEVWLVGGPSGGPTLLRRSQPLALKSGQAYEQVLSWTMPRAAPDQEIRLQLFRGSDPAPYRELRMWIDVQGN